jgi:hypothetical protein
MHVKLELEVPNREWRIISDNGERELRTENGELGTENCSYSCDPPSPPGGDNGKRAASRIKSRS